MTQADIKHKLPIDHLWPEAIIAVYAHYLRSSKGVRYVAPN